VVRTNSPTTTASAPRSARPASRRRCRPTWSRPRFPSPAQRPVAARVALGAHGAVDGAAGICGSVVTHTVALTRSPRSLRIQLDLANVSGDVLRAALGVRRRDRPDVARCRSRDCGCCRARPPIVRGVSSAASADATYRGATTVPHRAERPGSLSKETASDEKTLFLQPSVLTALTAARLALSGQAGNPLVLVSDLARPAAALVPEFEADRCPPARLPSGQSRRGARLRACGHAHLDPSFASDVKVAEALKDVNPRLKIGFVGAKVAVEPEASLTASSAVDFVAREEFDFTIKKSPTAAPSIRSTG